MKQAYVTGVAGLFVLAVTVCAEPETNAPALETTMAAAETNAAPAVSVVVVNAAETNAVGIDVAETLTGSWCGENRYIYEHEGWTLEVTFVNPGTRSEGQQGRLLNDGKPVEAIDKGDSLLTPLGLVKYYGEERVRAWDLTGWSFADRRKVKRAEDLVVKQDEPPKTH